MNKPFETYLPWFILREIPHLGNITCRRLLKEFGTPEAVLNASKEALKRIKRISARAVDGILNSSRFSDAARKELDLVLNNQIKIVTLNDPEYPPLLKQIADAPPVLTYTGSLDISAPCIAMVGSRAATSYGKSTSFNLAYRLASKGLQVVSGMARGIDARAHEGAIEAGGRTVAVLGSGLKKIYPRENQKLFEAISHSGTVFSEFKLYDGPEAAHFPMRNRIIAGLSCGCIVVEAAKKSGSLITARLAADYNREVFAVPGSISSHKSQGTHSLLKQGAKLVENEIDIIDELHHFIHEKKLNPTEIQPEPRPAETKKNYTRPLQNKNLTQYKKSEKETNINTIMRFIEPYPVHIDKLIEKSRMDAAVVSTILFDLEMQNKVMRHQGNYYSVPEEYH